jgi:hypothetical protein
MTPSPDPRPCSCPSCSRLASRADDGSHELTPRCVRCRERGCTRAGARCLAAPDTDATRCDR